MKKLSIFMLATVSSMAFATIASFNQYNAESNTIHSYRSCQVTINIPQVGERFSSRVQSASHAVLEDKGYTVSFEEDGESALRFGLNQGELFIRLSNQNGRFGAHLFESNNQSRGTQLLIAQAYSSALLEYRRLKNSFEGLPDCL